MRFDPGIKIALPVGDTSAELDKCRTRTILSAFLQSARVQTEIIGGASFVQKRGLDGSVSRSNNLRADKSNGIHFVSPRLEAN
ncbi:hypothetical protein AA0472_2186 [Acetobacter estunensis NRIC 0472]|nr:hypothetical protein AA0472_2186 [Acetobacter estunensis NRIC 0472]